MKPQRFLDNVEAVRQLSEKLSRSAKVRQYDTPDEPHSWTLVYGFDHLEESFRAFLDVHLRKLVEDRPSVDEVEDILHDIGEEFRHILYHIKDLKYYGYLDEDGGNSARSKLSG